MAFLRKAARSAIAACIIAGILFIYKSVNVGYHLHSTVLISNSNNFAYPTPIVCLVTGMLGKVGKVSFLADPSPVKRSIPNILTGRDIVLGMFTTTDNSIDDSLFWTVIPNDLPENVKLSTIRCVGTDKLGAMVFKSRSQNVFVHVFERTGDFYKICDVGFDGNHSFGDMVRSLDRFGLDEMLLQNHSTDCTLLQPIDQASYAFNYNSSRFLDCNRTSMNWLFKHYPNERQNDVVVDTKIKPGLVHLKRKGNELRKRFFMAGGTLLGWYRQCGIIEKSKDVDFAMLGDEYDDTVIDAFLGNKDLMLLIRYGVDPGPKELRLHNGKYTFDLFVLVYNASVDRLFGLYQASTRNYRREILKVEQICSAELLGVRLLVPCNPLKMIEHEYGHFPKWQIPRSGGGVWTNLKYSETFNKSYLYCTYQKRYSRTGTPLPGSYMENTSHIKCKI